MIKGLGQAMLGCSTMVVIFAMSIVLVTSCTAYVSDRTASAVHSWSVVGEQREQTERLRIITDAHVDEVRIVTDGYASVNLWDDVTDWSVTVPSVIIASLVLLVVIRKYEW